MIDIVAAELPIHFNDRSGSQRIAAQQAVNSAEKNDMEKNVAMYMISLSSCLLWPHQILRQRNPSYWPLVFGDGGYDGFHDGLSAGID